MNSDPRVGAEDSALSVQQRGESPADAETQFTIAVDLITLARGRVKVDVTDTLPPGQQLGSFRILQHLGGGGMGQVYRARDQRLNREVAIKILPRAFGHDPDLRARFDAEARAASALNHPNIVAVHDIGREDDLCWIVSELVEGQSLRQTLEAGELAPRRAAEIAAQIAEGLAAAHAVGLVHRDLKPENIMLTRENRVKILDFGLAKGNARTAADNSENITVTQAGVVLGTPGYMSPEQIAGSEVDHRSDIFSLGVILYEMLAQKRPFTAENRYTIMHVTMTEEPAALPPTLPVDLTRITFRCLEKKPQRRLQSAADVAFALQMATASGSQTLLPRLWTQERRIARPVLAALFLLAGLGLLWAILLLRPSRPSLQGTLRRLTWDDALTTDGAISPDGRFVAYASDRANASDYNIYLQQVNQAGILQLTNDTDGNDEPTFSPDGSRIAFESRRGRGGIYEIPSLGGEKHLVIDGGRHPRFSPDGQFLLYARVGNEAAMYGGVGTQLFAQPLSGGTPVSLTQRCTHVVPEAVWSPDSQQILASATCDGKSGLWLISRDGKSLRLTNGGELWAKHGLNSSLGLRFQVLDQWLSNPPRILLPLMQEDAQYEVAIPVASNGSKFLDSIQPVNFGPGKIVHGSAATDGRIALTVREESSNLWKLPVGTDGLATGEAEPITNAKNLFIHPALSPDGQHVAFISYQAGRDELRLLDLRSGTHSTLTIRTGFLRHPVFSRDGMKISYQAEKATLQMGIGGGSASSVLPEADGYVSDWSSDGKWFLWEIDAPDQSGIALVDRATLTKRIILRSPDHSLYQAHFSAGDRFVVFNSEQHQHSRIYAARLRTGPVPVSEWIPLTDGSTWDDKPRLSPDGRLLFFISDRDGLPCIWVQRLSPDMQPSGAPRAVWHSHAWRRSLSGAGIGNLELNAGRDMLIFTLGEASGDIWVLDPPQGEAKQ